MSMTWVPCGVAMTLESLHEFAMLISLMSKFQESSVMKVSSQDSIFDTGSHVDESFHEMAMLMSQDLASVAALSKRPSSKSLRPGCWLFAVGCFLLTIIEFKMGLYLSISQSMFALSMLLINCSVSSSRWAGTGSCRQE